MSDFVKITKIHKKRNPYNGLTREEGFTLEKDCLSLLNLNFECVCGLNRNHFPIIQKDVPETYKLILSNCGIALNTYQTLSERRKTKSYVIKKLEEQIDCIMYNLQKCNIKHLDIRPKNICINKEGILSLIDFDIAVINDVCLSKQIANRYEMDNDKPGPMGTVGYKKLKSMLLNTINNILTRPAI